MTAPILDVPLALWSAPLDTVETVLLAVAAAQHETLRSLSPEHVRQYRIIKEIQPCDDIK